MELGIKGIEQEIAKLAKEETQIKHKMISAMDKMDKSEHDRLQRQGQKVVDRGNFLKQSLENIKAKKK